MSDEPLKTAILVDGKTVQHWAAQALSTMVDETNASVELVIINEEGKSSKESLIKKILLNLAHMDVNAWKVYNLVRRIKSKLSNDNELRASHKLSKISYLDDANFIQCEPISVDGIGNKLPSGIVQKLASMDLAVRFGFGILKGEALQAPKYGVLSFHHDDLRKYRGRPAGFWEYLNGDQVGAVTLQRLNEKLDGGEIIELQEVDISDANSWPEVLRRLHKLSGPMLAKGVQDLANPDFSPKKPDTLGDLYTNPGWKALFKYLVKQTKI